jgi:ATP-binding cassette subfamily B protein/subfamily B ATP-binding cassette protein MsbA
MKNFLRALRHALPYRRRLVLSILCAGMAALLWGLNFTSIYPVLKLLHSEQSPHQWVDGQIAQLEKEVKDQEGPMSKLTVQKEHLEAELDFMRHDADLRERTAPVEQRIRDTTRELSRFEHRLGTARSNLYYYQVARKFIYKLLPPDCFQTLVGVIVLVLVGIVIKCFFEFAQESLVGSVVNLSLFDLRNRFYRNVIHLDVDQFGEQGSSELMARFTNDMESLGAGLKALFGRLVAEPLRAVSCVLMACFISWRLTLMFLILVPVAGLILARVGRIMKQATRRLLERMSNIYKILQESFQGIRVVKAFTMEPYERRRFCSATKDYYHRAMKVVNIDALADPIIEVLGVTAVAAALLAGSYLVLKKSNSIWGVKLTDQPLEAASMLQLYIYLAMIADPVRKLSSVFTRLQSACAAADRIFAYVDRQPRVRGNSDGPRMRLARPGAPRPEDGHPVPAEPAGRPDFVEFRNVCFSYEPQRPILSNISLAVASGETIALVGRNGSGKTTMLGLLPRFFDPDHGAVVVDGLDVRAVHLRSLRQGIGIVTQDTILFDDTIYNNIAYGSRGAQPGEVEAAAQRAFADEFIAKLPRGYQTRVGELGGKLSGGQKQRLALARAILRDPAILILDEFTSQIDNESEAMIHSALKDFIVGRTTFLISHRPNTLELADRIVMLENGRIAAVGTHAELMAGCVAYQRLHEAHDQRRVA